AAGTEPAPRQRGCTGPSLVARGATGTASMVARGVGAALRTEQELGEWPACAAAGVAGLDPGTNPCRDIERARGDEVSGAARARERSCGAGPGHGVDAVAAHLASSRRAVLRLASRHRAHARADRAKPADLFASASDPRCAAAVGGAALPAGSRGLGRHRAPCPPSARGPPARRVAGERTERGHCRVRARERRGATTHPALRTGDPTMLDEDT